MTPACCVAFQLTLLKVFQSSGRTESLIHWSSSSTSLVFRGATCGSHYRTGHRTPVPLKLALSDAFSENDLIALQRLSGDSAPRLCAVGREGNVIPLCLREHDVETDLFADPREYSETIWSDPDDDQVTKVYGEAFYGQRPVPSLGGGPGYGAEADEVWSTNVELIEEIRSDGVHLPVLDVGIAHGEKARGGAI